MGKSRVIPTLGKLWSVPRKELMAAVTYVDLVEHIRKALTSISISKDFYWTDSMTVLTWVRSEAET